MIYLCLLYQKTIYYMKLLKITPKMVQNHSKYHFNGNQPLTVFRSLIEPEQSILDQTQVTFVAINKYVLVINYYR